MTGFAATFAAALIGAIGFASAAQATFSPVTVGGDTFTVNSCGGAICSSLTMVADGTGFGVEFEVAGGGTILTSGGETDVSLDIGVSGSRSITSVGALLAGSNGGNSANNSLAAISESVTYSFPSGVVNTTAYLNGPEVWDTIPSGYSILDIKKDVKITTPVVAGTTVTVTGIYQDLLPVPEPASIALLLAGLTVAAGARRNRRRA